MVSQAELISRGYQSLVSGLISILLETVWVPLSEHEMQLDYATIVFLSSLLCFDVCFSLLFLDPVHSTATMSNRVVTCMTKEVY